MPPVISRVLLLLHGVLALAVLAGVYVSALLAVICWLGMVYVAIISHGVGNGTITYGVGLGAAFSAISIAVIVRELVRMGRPVGVRPGSILVGPEEAPGLHQAVAGLARRIGTAPPAEIRVTAEAELSVSDIGPMFGLLPGVRRLYVGAPLLACMDPVELHAVLAHELGHLARSHSRFTVPVSRGGTAMAVARRRVEELARTNASMRYHGVLPMFVVSFYAWIFDLLTLPLRRRQERESDLIAARVAGVEPLVEGLLSAAVLQELWPAYRRQRLDRLRDRNIFPENPYEAFAEYLSSRVDQEPLRVRVLAARPSRGASHPPLAVRVARIRSGAAVAPLGVSETPVRSSVFVQIDAALAGSERWPTGKWTVLDAIADDDLGGLPRTARTLDDVLCADGVPPASLLTICAYAILRADRAEWRMSLRAELAGWVARAGRSTAGLAALRRELGDLGVSPAEVIVPDSVLAGLVPPVPRSPLPRNAPLTTWQALRQVRRDPLRAIPLTVMLVVWTLGALLGHDEDDRGATEDRVTNILIRCGAAPAACEPYLPLHGTAGYEGGLLNAYGESGGVFGVGLGLGQSQPARRSNQ